ncbi:Retrovirus-related Pol poly from transposon [Labeo rohita]|uniref:Gypsy retrotransposon integrase-like protein 1 n=1 Tax=Labeo rohita TaxID=84645 RepID=A0A498MLW0_LABRO|nr:Retrovirus-related Pol poly from transposon [Labeo rohita]
MPLNFKEYMHSCMAEASQDVISASMERVVAERRNPCRGVGLIQVSALSLVKDSETSQPLTPEQIRKAQGEDEILSRVLWYKSQNRRPNRTEVKAENPAVAILLKQWLKINVGQDGVLCRRTSRREQLLLPKAYHPLVFKELHQDMGHLGVERMLDLIREQFYWPQMSKDVEHFVTRVCECLKKKKPSRQTRAPLIPIQTTYPFRLVSIDFLHLDKCKHGYEYILVVMDHFTRFAQVYTTRNKAAKMVGNKIFNDFALKFGFPSRLHHDMGKEFENRLMASLKKLSGIQVSHTTPYHPQGNGQVERFNRTLLSMLRTLEDKEKEDWKESLAKVVHAYNCTKNEATGYVPYYLIFGHSPHLPIDLLFNLGKDESHETYDDYGAARGKVFYDRKVQGRDFHPGDRVLLRNLTPRGGPVKIQTYWENQVYKVKERKADGSPVYEIGPENGKGRDKVVHRNLLLPCDFLPSDQPPVERLQPQKNSLSSPKERTRLQHQQQHHPEQSDTSDNEYGGTYRWHLRASRQRPQKQTLLNPLAEPFQPQRQRPQRHEEDVLLRSEEDVPLQSEEDVPLQSEEDVPLQSQRPDLGCDRPEYGESRANPLPSTPVVHQTVRERPQRLKHQPVVLSYDTLGQPSLVPQTVRSGNCLKMGCQE